MGLRKCAWKLLILLLISTSATSQVRFYVASLTPSVTATFHSGWNVTTGAINYSLIQDQRTRNNIGAMNSGASGAVAPRKMLIGTFISAPLLGQTLNCTIDGQMKMAEGNAASVTGQGWCYVRLLNSDGTVSSELGTMTTTNLTGVSTNRTWTQLTLTSVAVTGGQRISFEVGFNYSVGTLTANLATFAFNDNATTDLPVDNTTTTTLCTWWQFSQSVQFISTTQMF